MSEYVWEDGPLFIKHLDGVKWYEAPVPPRKHKCWPQTMGILPSGEDVYRCACGATRNPRWKGWLEVNSRELPEEFKRVTVGDRLDRSKVGWWQRHFRWKRDHDGFYDTERGDY